MNIIPFLLIGTLSMFFAEILSGASHLWYIDAWSLLITYQLYLFHLLFFIYIANKYNRISIPQLYLLGIFFGLYEAWITKVIWWGYEEQMSFVMGSILGVGVGEYLILTLFWHPIISFILPLLVYQIITNKSIESHNKTLEKTKSKSTLIYLTTILISSFVAFNFQFNIITIYLSILGSILIIYLLSKNVKGDITNLIVKSGFIYVLTAMIFLYVAGFFILNPTHLPTDILAYLIIIFTYLFVWYLFKKSNENKLQITNLPGNSYSKSDLKMFLITLLISTTIFSIFLSPIAIIVFSLSYLVMCLVGLYILFRVIREIL